jgi:hypothetical protein
LSRRELRSSLRVPAVWKLFEYTPSSPGINETQHRDDDDDDDDDDDGRQ